MHSKELKQIMPDKITLRKEQINLLEKTAVLLEKTGLQPALAKILSLLLVNDDPEMTFDQIRETLSLSKSATSQALNQLLTLEKIEYKTKIGDRKRYFCSRVMSWQDDTKAQMEGLDFFSNLLQQILDQRPSKTKEFNSSLKKLIAFMNFLAKEMPALYQKFEEKAA